VTAELLAGLLAGYSVAVPVGPMATYLVALTARTSVRVGAAAALGIATVDGLYAVAAMLGGAALAEFLQPALGVLHWASVAVLAGVAARAVGSGLRPVPAQRVSGAEPVRASGAEPVRVSGTEPVRTLSPARAYATLAGLTLVNPTTLVCFAALVVGLRAGSAPGVLGQVVFVAAAFAASASWQLLLAGGGALLGRLLTGARGRRLTAVVSGVLIGVLAVRLAVS
jgi:threonine/homoserine/homoserine lactone efflux protein